MIASFLALLRNQPASILCVVGCLPSLALVPFLDATPEAFRVKVSRVFFGLDVCTLCAWVALIQAGVMKNDEASQALLEFQYSATDQALTAITNLLIFGVKNLVMSMWSPGSLVITKSTVVSVRIPEELANANRDVHADVVLAAKNSTLWGMRARTSVKERDKSDE